MSKERKALEKICEILRQECPERATVRIARYMDAIKEMKDTVMESGDEKRQDAALMAIEHFTGHGMNRCQCGRLISHHKHMCLACMWHEAKRRAETMKIKPKEIKVCKKCGKEFFPKNSTREIYCSDKCRKQATYQMQKARRKWGICMICGAEFEYSAINRRKRCDECTEADIRKPYKLAEKKRTTPDEKRSSAAEKAARLARLPEGADPRDAWMRDVGAIPIKTETARGKAKAFIRISPAKLRAPFLPPTREWRGKAPEERELRAENGM